MLRVSCSCLGLCSTSCLFIPEFRLYLGYAILVGTCIKNLCSKLAYVTILLTLFGLEKSCDKPNNREGKYSLTVG